MTFDPDNSAAADSGLFALPWSTDEASIVIVPAPWDATSSQERGSSQAYRAVYDASKFVELYDPRHGRIYDKRIAMAGAREELLECHRLVTRLLGANHSDHAFDHAFDHAELERLCETFNTGVETEVGKHLDAGKKVGLLGGDHAVSYGAIKAHLLRDPDLGILHIDAHCDLRQAFDGITYSHASIMFNVMERLHPAQLVQVGIRAICDAEAAYLQQAGQITVFFDQELHTRCARGERWHDLCAEIADRLPPRVYLSLDIDGLEPSCCPHTGTPVPGGLSYNDLLYLLNHVTRHGVQIVGFDLVEVHPAATDANIAAHLLYQICGVI